MEKLSKQAFQMNVGIVSEHIRNKLSEDHMPSLFRAHSKLIIKLIGDNADLRKRIEALEEKLKDK